MKEQFPPESTEEFETQLGDTSGGATGEDAEGHGSFEGEVARVEESIAAEVGGAEQQAQQADEEAQKFAVQEQIEAIRAELTQGAGNLEATEAPRTELAEILRGQTRDELVERDRVIFEVQEARRLARGGRPPNEIEIKEGGALSAEIALIHNELQRRVKEKARAEFAAYNAANPQVETPITASTAPEKQGLLKRVGGWFAK